MWTRVSVRGMLSRTLLSGLLLCVLGGASCATTPSGSPNLLREDAFQGKRVLVTGATSGIGRATAERFVELGAHVVFSGRNEKVLEEIKSIHASTSRVSTVCANLADPEACKSLISAAVALLPGGKIDVLVNNAGVLPRLGMSIESTTLEEYTTTLDVNLRAPFLLLRESIPHMPPGSAVVNVGSLASVRPLANLTVYSMSKAALEALTKCAALELAARGIRVNAINPATVITDIHRRAGMQQEAYERYLVDNNAMHPLGRPGMPSDCSALITYLASDACSWMTGQCVGLDGGRSLCVPAAKDLTTPAEGR